MATKITVELPDNLYQRTQRFARRHQQDVEAVVSDLFQEALAAREAQEEVVEQSGTDSAVEREMAAYIAMHPILKQKYMGQHVAVYHGELVDHDKDFGALYERIEKAYPDEFVWLATVEDEPLPTIYHRSTHLA